MIISFIGSPCSGKTTTAAMLFAFLKEHGFPCEFIPEQARLYIAKLRVARSLKPKDHLELIDEDQKEIMHRQWDFEDTMVQACGPNTVIVTDSSPLNALLYMSSEYRSTAPIKALIEKVLAQNTVYFYTPPILGISDVVDPNRVHSRDQSLKIDQSIASVLREVAPSIVLRPLRGNATERHCELTQYILNTLVSA